jgi:hypothetical protein
VSTLPPSRPATIHAVVVRRANGHHEAEIVCEYDGGRKVIDYLFGPPAYTLDRLVADIRTRWKVEPAIPGKLDKEWRETDERMRRSLDAAADAGGE